jgi:hypothetical protein
MRIPKKNVKLIFSAIILISCIKVFHTLFINRNYLKEEICIAITMINLSIAHLRPRTHHVPSSPMFESNSTHLWSFRLADDQYDQLATLLPCRIVTYIGLGRNDRLDSCDHSASAEFTVQRTLNAQKWIFNHQHPTNCTNKRFAIINSYPLSGFGSIVHQIAWAFDKALSEERIAVYAAPGNWVSRFDLLRIATLL